jgi:PAS domain S-box-containing protein
MLNSTPTPVADAPAERDILESHLLRLFFDSPFIGMAVTSPRSKRWVKFNDELCRILGYRRDELEQLTWTAITHLEDVAADLDQFHRVLAREIDGYQMEKRFIRPDRTVVDTAIDVRCVRDSGGLVEYFLATIRDITESRLVTSELQFANERWESLVKASPAAIFDMDLAGRVQSVWNPAAERMFGQATAGILGRALPIRDQELSDAVKALQAQVAAGQFISSREFTVQCKDGTAVSFEVSAAPILDKAGGVRSLLCVADDVTERLAVQRALRESERGYRLLFQLHPTPMCVYDVSTRRMLAVNSAAIESYGYAPDEFLRLRMDDMVAPVEVPRAIEYIASIPAGAERTGVWRHRRKDGSQFDAEIRSHSLTFGGRKARLVMATDVSDTLRAQRELQVSENRLRKLNLELEDRIAERTRELVMARDRAESADRVKSLFLATVSHELRTPLNSIIGFSDALRRELAGPLNEEQAKQLRIVFDAGQHLLALIGDFLDISKIEAGVISYNLVDLDLLALMPAITSAFGQQAATVGLEFRLQDDLQPCVIRADAQRVKQVIGNYFSNAIKFTDQGRITVGVERRANVARIWLRDTGIGIAADQAGRLFQPFVRLSPQGHRSSDGTGLGLAIARRLAEGMQGRVGFESEPGRGSLFWIDLPLADCQERPCVS